MQGRVTNYQYKVFSHTINSHGRSETECVHSTLPQNHGHSTQNQQTCHAGRLTHHQLSGPCWNGVCSRWRRRGFMRTLTAHPRRFRLARFRSLRATHPSRYQIDFFYCLHSYHAPPGFRERQYKSRTKQRQFGPSLGAGGTARRKRFWLG
jgi:hypothetical protein